jgi:tetratricopeptide (TPR) repeat protein
MFHPPRGEIVMARQRFALVTGALLVVAGAGSLGAQSMSNQQRPLRPGQVRGPFFMVPVVMRSAEKGLGQQVADAVRERLMNDNLATTIYIMPKKDVVTNLEQSGYSATDALTDGDLRQLASFIRAEEYIDGTVTRNADGTITLNAMLKLPRGQGLEQPLPEASGAKPSDIAGRISREISEARKQIKPAADCEQSRRQRNYEEAKANAAKGIKEYEKSIFARMCLLETHLAQKAAPDTLIKVAEEVLAIHPANDRALAVVVDAYATMAATDKSYLDKYIEALQKLLAADPTNTTLQLQIVEALASANKMDLAKPVIDSAVKQNPGDPGLVRMQWRVYRALGDWKGVVRIGEEMIRHDTAAADTMFWQQMVAAYLSDSQPQKAQEAASRGAAKFANNVTLWLSVAQLSRQNGQLPQALEATNRLLSIDSKNSAAALQKAQVFSDMDQVDSMVAALRYAVEIGAAKEIAGGMMLTKANPWFQRWQKDSAKTSEEGERILTLLVLSDSLSPSPGAALLGGLTYLLLGNQYLTDSREPKSCELATKGSQYVAKSQETLPRAGRQFPNETASAMNSVMQLQGYAEQLVRAFCRPG